MRKLKCKHYVVLILLLLAVSEYCGLFRYLQQRSYDTEFSYPSEGDLHTWSGMLKAGKTPPVAPEYAHQYYISRNPREKCLSSDGSHYDQLRLVYLVKSAVANSERRQAIRKSWGFEKRFSDVPIRTVFLLGQAAHDVKLQAKVESEARLYGDIVQADFQV